MPRVVDLPAYADARAIVRIERALAVVDAGTTPDDGRRTYAQARAERDVELKCRVWPTADKVAALTLSHGVHAVRERWPYVSNDELARLAARGGARGCRP